MLFRSVVLDVRDDSESVTVFIRDTGIGMGEADLLRALQPFHQVDESLNRRQGGTGLGLPLAKDLVELHGGRLSLESAPDAGTTARVDLPKRSSACA